MINKFTILNDINKMFHQTLTKTEVKSEHLHCTINETKRIKKTPPHFLELQIGIRPTLRTPSDVQALL